MPEIQLHFLLLDFGGNDLTLPIENDGEERK